MNDQLRSLAVMCALACSCTSAPQPLLELEPGGADAPVYAANEVHERPRLIRCSEARGPSPNVMEGVRWDLVTLQFVVLEDGGVDPHTIHSTHTEAIGRDRPASDRSIEEARHRALTCRYTPGSIAGHPVRVKTERTFRILAQS